MSKRWRLAGLILAVAAFSYTMLTGNGLLAVTDGVPIVASAFLGAAATFFVVWLYEAIFTAVRWIWRRLFPTPQPSDPGD